MKNKRLCILCLILWIGYIVTTEYESNTPEDNSLSSGYSVNWGNMVKIDSRESVKNYTYKSQNDVLLKEKKYNFWNEINIFGNGTREEYPQGLCFTEDFVIISSYSGVRGNLGKIRVYDRSTGEYLLALGMDENSHLGGVTYDGAYIWVCNSSKMSIERISYSFIKYMVRQNKGKIIDARNLVDHYRVNNIPSCVTYYEGQLFVTTHSIWTNAKMIGYYYNSETNRLYSEFSYWVPPKVQGVAFTESGEVLLSTSYGRKQSSYIKKYSSLSSMSKDVKDYVEQIELPPCSEGIVYEEEKIYIIFESAGKKYLEGTDGKGQSVAPIDKILVIYDK